MKKVDAYGRIKERTAEKGGIAVVTREINQFRLSVGGYTDIRVGVPCSVLSALTQEGVLREPYFGENCLDMNVTSSLGAVFETEFEVDALTLGMDHSLLRISGVDAPAVLLLNDSPIATLSRSEVCYEFDVKRNLRLGRNTLVLRFPGREGGALTDIAIFAPIELVSYNKCIIDEVIVDSKQHGGSMHLDISVTTQGYATGVRIVAVLVSPGGSVSYCTVSDGKGWMDIPTPNLWRPDGVGNARLYKLGINLYSDSELIDTKEYRIGLRTVEYDPAASPALSLSGNAFYPTVLAHGEGDLLKPRASDARTALMLRRAKDAGVSMIYLTGRSCYPGDRFLSLCDELGIALAIDIISHGDVQTPIETKLADKDFYRALRRFANHPSVVAFVGVERGNRIYDVIKRLIPGAACIDSLDFDVCAAPSLPTGYTLRKYFSDADRNVYSRALSFRCRSGWDMLLDAIYKSYRMPSSFDEWCYLAGVISGEMAESRLRSDRRSMKGAGSLCAFLSEPMPAISASLLDYSARAKAMYYYLRRLSGAADTYVVADGAKISFYTTNMQTKIYKAKLSYAVIDREGRAIARDSVGISADPFGTYNVFECDLTDVISGHEREYLITYSVSDGPEVHSTGSCMLVPVRDFALNDPNLRVEVSGASTEYTVTVSADSYARAVEVYLEGDEDAILENNFFDITSDLPVRVKLVTQRPTAIETVRREIRVRSMYDVGRG